MQHTAPPTQHSMLLLVAHAHPPAPRLRRSPPTMRRASRAWASSWRWTRRGGAAPASRWSGGASGGSARSAPQRWCCCRVRPGALTLACCPPGACPIPLHTPLAPHRSGEDLTPYRAASKQIQAVLRRFGPVERLGLDEFFLDATPEVGAAGCLVGGRVLASAHMHGRGCTQRSRSHNAHMGWGCPTTGPPPPLRRGRLQAQRRLAALRAAAGAAPPRLPPWRGHVHSSGTQLVQDSRHRPMDLRAVPSSASSAGGEVSTVAASGASSAAAAAAGGGSSEQGGGGSSASWEALLRLGSAIAAGELGRGNACCGHMPATDAAHVQPQ